MSVIAALINGNSTACSAAWLGWHHRKHHSHTLLALWEGNPPVPVGFPSPRTSNTETVLISWRHHVFASLSNLHLFCKRTCLRLISFTIYLMICRCCSILAQYNFGDFLLLLSLWAMNPLTRFCQYISAGYTLVDIVLNRFVTLLHK